MDFRIIFAGCGDIRHRQLVSDKDVCVRRDIFNVRFDHAADRTGYGIFDHNGILALTGVFETCFEAGHKSA